VHNEGVNGAASTLSMWHKEAFTYDSHVVGKGFIVVVGHHVKSNCLCVIANVYTTCSLSEKIELWEALFSLRRQHQDKVWCCCGDFNAVRCAEERRGVRENASNKNEIRGFNDFIGRNLMDDLPIVGKKYTWYKADGSAKNRLDRVLVSEEWLQVWPTSKQYVQARVVSDHCAIMVKSWLKDWDPKPFKTIDAWLKEPGFKNLVKEKWKAYEVQGNDISMLGLLVSKFKRGGVN